MLFCPRALLTALLFATLPGCGTTYLIQAASGEWHVLRARKPIDAVLADPHTPQTVRDRLTEVRAARDFASRELKLPDNRSYRSYADIGRPYVVWNVVAAPEFSVNPKRWCFPVAGCVAYRGYFSERRARAFAAGLAKRGFDVALAGVPAYSTLGKFADPVLSTMLRYGPDELAAIIFHELAHQLLYVADDTEFNEAFAVTVEDAGLERWLRFNGQADRIERYRQERARDQAFIELLARAHALLCSRSGAGAPAARRATCAAVQAAQLRSRLGRLTGRPEMGRFSARCAAGNRSAPAARCRRDRWVAPRASVEGRSPSVHSRRPGRRCRP